MEKAKFKSVFRRMLSVATLNLVVAGTAAQEVQAPSCLSPSLGVVPGVGVLKELTPFQWPRYLSLAIVVMVLPQKLTLGVRMLRTLGLLPASGRGGTTTKQCQRVV
jgi:hypothetical protein